MGYTVNIYETTNGVNVSASGTNVNITTSTNPITISYNALELDGVNITNANVNASGNLILTLSNSAVINAGRVTGNTGATGATGANGATGSNGISVTNSNINASGNLIFTYSNSATTNAGNIRYIISQEVSNVANAGVTSINGLTGVVTLTTANIAESGNQYFTNARARTAITVTGDGSYDNATGQININTYGNTNVAAYLPTYAGALTASSLTTTGAVTIGGNLTVNGNITTINANVITVNDKNIVVANNQSTSAGIDGSGIDAGGGTPIATWRYNNATTSWQSNIAITPAANATSNMGGTSNYWKDVYAANINAVTLTGTIQTAAQTNITSLGTLSGLTLSGTLNGTTLQAATIGNLNAQFTGNGRNLTSLTGANVSGTVANATYATQAAQANNANLATTATYVTGLTSANVTTALGFVPADSNSASNYGNANVAAYLPTYSGNLNSVTAIPGAAVTGTVANASYSLQSGQANNANAATTATTATYVTGLTSANVTTALGFVPADSNSASNYGNANVASYLPTYTGNIGANIAGSSPFITATGTNANVTINPNGLGSLVLNAPLIASGNVTASYFIGNGSLLTNLPVQPGTYSNVNVAAYLPTYTGNVGAGNVVTTGGSVINSNVATGNINISGSGVVYTPTVQATTSAGGALKNATGTTQAAWGAGGGDNFTISVSTNLTGANAQVDISPTGTGHVHIKPTGTGSVEIAPTNVGSMNNMTIGNVTPQAANVTALGASGNVTASYFIGNGSQLTGITAISNYNDTNVAAYLPTYSGNLGGTLTTAAQTNITRVGNLTTANVTGSVLAFGNVGNQYFIGHSINNTFANTATYSDVKIAGWQYSSPTGTNVAAAAMSLTGNIQLTRTNDNTNARVRPLVITGLFDANGFSSSIGISPFSNSGSDTNLVVGISRMPAVVQQFNIVNSQATAVNISSAGGMVTTAGISATNQRANVNYMVGQTVEVGLFANDTTSRIINATAYRADFATLTSNTANVGNRIAFECVDSTANIKIAGNIVSTTGAVVAPRVTIQGFTETLVALGNTSGTFAPNLANGTIQTLTLTGNLTFDAFTSPVTGQSGTFVLTQDGTGNRTLSSTMKFAGGYKTLSNSAAAIDLMTVFYDGTNYYASLTTGYA